MTRHRHHLRLDDMTQSILDELCRLTCSTKSSIMRRHVQEGVRKDINDYTRNGISVCAKRKASNANIVNHNENTISISKNIHLPTNQKGKNAT